MRTYSTELGKHLQGHECRKIREFSPTLPEEQPAISVVNSETKRERMYNLPVVSLCLFLNDGTDF